MLLVTPCYDLRCLLSCLSTYITSDIQINFDSICTSHDTITTMFNKGVKRSIFTLEHSRAAQLYSWSVLFVCGVICFTTELITAFSFDCNGIKYVNKY